MQSKNKNDGVQLSTRYGQYCFAKRHLRGTRRPEVFPFIGTDSEDTRQLKYVGQVGDADWAKDGKNLSRNAREGYRVYDDSGLAPTLRSQLGGASKGSQIIQLNQPTHSNDRVYGTDGVSPTLNTMQGGNRQPFIEIAEATKQGYAVAHEGDSINLSVPNSKTRRGRVGHGIAQTVDTGMQQHTLQNSQIRRLTPTECERLQGFPDKWTKTNVFGGKGVSDTQRYKQCGNAVTVNVIKDIMERLLI